LALSIVMISALGCSVEERDSKRNGGAPHAGEANLKSDPSSGERGARIETKYSDTIDTAPANQYYSCPLNKITCNDGTVKSGYVGQASINASSASNAKTQFEEGPNVTDRCLGNGGVKSTDATCEVSPASSEAQQTPTAS